MLLFPPQACDLIVELDHMETKNRLAKEKRLLEEEREALASIEGVDGINVELRRLSKRWFYDGQVGRVEKMASEYPALLHKAVVVNLHRPYPENEQPWLSVLEVQREHVDAAKAQVLEVMDEWIDTPTCQDFQNGTCLAGLACYIRESG